MPIAVVPDLKGHQQAATECEQSQGDGINSIELGSDRTKLRIDSIPNPRSL